MGCANRMSVVVPTHGRVELFRKTLVSIEAQTCSDFQLVVTDDSAEVDDRQAIASAVDQYRRRTGRSADYVFTAARLGQAANTNQGLRAATAPVLRILHSDDIVRPECFQWELQQFERYPEMGLLFQDCLPFLHDSELTWDRPPMLRLVEPADYFRQNLSIRTALPSGLLFSAESFKEVGGMREDWCFLCDWDLFAKLLLRGIRLRQFAGYATAGNYGWRLHDDSTTTTKWRQHFIEHRDLLQQWQRSLEPTDVDLFVNSYDRDNFFRLGERYRTRRLIHDVSNLSSTDFFASLNWFRQTLSGSLQSKVMRKAAPKVLKRKIRSQLGIASRSMKSDLPENTATQSPSGSDAWRPELTLCAMHGDNTNPPSGAKIVLPYDNSINLWPLRHQIRSAKRIRVTDLNLNRFYRLTLSECLKYVSPGCEIEFDLHDNEHLTWFGLKAVLEQVASGRFDAIFQNHDPRSATANGHSKWILRYRCIRSDSPWHVEPMSGLTIGVLTLGDRADELDRLVRSARQHCDVPCQILLIGPKEIAAFAHQDDVRQLLFHERDDLGWITRKKNLICDAAAYSDIVVCHDRFEFTESFFEAFHTWGTAYGIAAVRLQLPDGKRALDWAVVQGENHSWCKGGLLHYRDYSRFSYVPGGVTLIRKSFWQQFPWSENLYWNEHEDVELCRRIQRAGHRISFFPGMMIALRDRWVDENPLIPFSDQRDL